MSAEKFDDVTELPGEEISSEQLFRIYNRYHWTAEYCQNKDVLEVACGSGAGIGYLARFSKSVTAGDYSQTILDAPQNHYKSQFDIRCFDAQDMPFEKASFDVVVMHEALYYIPDADQFLKECCRVLRPGGIVLITSANKDLFDFSPSPHSTVYRGAQELKSLLFNHGFDVKLFGSIQLAKIGLKQKITRPIKWLAVRLNLIPKTMRGKRLLKRLVFGRSVLMPAEIVPDMTAIETLTPISGDTPCLTHKIIYCHAFPK